MAFEVIDLGSGNRVEIDAPEALQGRLLLTGNNATIRIGTPAQAGRLEITAEGDSRIVIESGISFGTLTITSGRASTLTLGTACRLDGALCLTVPERALIFVSDACGIGAAGAARVLRIVATQPTRLKISMAPASGLPPADKLEVAAGARLSGQVIHETAEYWLVEQAALDGVPVPAALRFVLKAHWRPAAPEGVTLDEALLRACLWQFVSAGQEGAPGPLAFERGGRLSGYRLAHAVRWQLQRDELHLHNGFGKLAWRFHVVRDEQGQIGFNGVSAAGAAVQLRRWTAASTAVAAPAPAAAPADEAVTDDQVKLVIWDLDETFWEGTLAEGGIRPIAANIELVRELSGRGIVNAICSKNHFDVAKDKLVELGIWEHFIFPRIAFAPKGAMIQDIITSAQLRAASVLFLDDNHVNINEAQHYNPGLQTALPEAIPALLADPRLKGKPDPGHTRLARYKILESKHADRAQAGSDNLDFLRQSGVRISFHHDVEAQFPRIHDLVNRTNQLNFTKSRWPEDEAAAHEAFLQEMKSEFHTHCGYVKVADRYGSYGICGFYMVSRGESRHFLFSCRSINMGIEQFVWHRIGRPNVKTVGEVVATLGELPDWITIVGDAEATADADAGPVQAAGAKSVICVRGACDLSMMTHYLRMHYDILEEFPYPYQGWEIHPVARAVPLQEQAESAAGAALLSKLPGFPAGRFTSAVNSGEADVYMLSFSSETFCGRYRSRSTGMVLPLRHKAFSGRAFAETSYEALMAKQAVEITAEQWAFMQQDLEFIGSGVDARLGADVRYVFEKLRGKIVIVLILNSVIGSERGVLGEYAKVNKVVRPLVEEFGYTAIDLATLVKSVDDLVSPRDGGVHFGRHVYTQLAELVSAAIASQLKLQAQRNVA